MPSPIQTKKQPTVRYQATPDLNEHPASSFRKRFGRRTIQRLDLEPGARVLDVSSPSHGKFGTGDPLNGDCVPEQFDAVVCAFGILGSDMAAGTEALWRLVRPGGMLAITTWGPDFFEPASTWFWNAIRSIRPDLHKTSQPSSRVYDRQALLALFSDLGITDIQVAAEANECPLSSPNSWWMEATSSVYRDTVEQLDAADYAYVRSATLHSIHYSGISSVNANVLYATAKKLESDRPFGDAELYVDGPILTKQSTRLFV